MTTHSDYSIFIADLHLSDEMPALTAQFLTFLDHFQHSHFEELFILGDLFEYWVGDDQIETDTSANQVCQKFQYLTQTSGKKIYILHGNRDFLLGQDFFGQSGAQLLPTQYCFQNQWIRIILTHGDELCLNDTAYQTFREMVHTLAWQYEFLAQALPIRMHMAQGLRARSKTEQLGKDDYLFQIPSEAILSLLQQKDCPVLVHGHTHQGSQKSYEMTTQAGKKQAATVWTLPDWRPKQQGCLILEKDKLSLHNQFFC